MNNRPGAGGNSKFDPTESLDQFGRPLYASTKIVPTLTLQSGKRFHKCRPSNQHPRVNGKRKGKA